MRNGIIGRANRSLAAPNRTTSSLATAAVILLSSLQGCADVETGPTAFVARLESQSLWTSDSISVFSSRFRNAELEGQSLFVMLGSDTLEWVPKDDTTVVAIVPELVASGSYGLTVGLNSELLDLGPVRVFGYTDWGVSQQLILDWLIAGGPGEAVAYRQTRESNNLISILMNSDELSSIRAIDSTPSPRIPGTSYTPDRVVVSAGDSFEVVDRVTGNRIMGLNCVGWRGMVWSAVAEIGEGRCLSHAVQMIWIDSVAPLAELNCNVPGLKKFIVSAELDIAVPVSGEMGETQDCQTDTGGWPVFDTLGQVKYVLPNLSQVPGADVDPATGTLFLGSKNLNDEWSVATIDPRTGGVIASMPVAAPIGDILFDDRREVLLVARSGTPEEGGGVLEIFRSSSLESLQKVVVSQPTTWFLGSTLVPGFLTEVYLLTRVSFAIPDCCEGYYRLVFELPERF